MIRSPAGLQTPEQALTTSDPTLIEGYLAPLVALALRQPEIEALVFWGDGAGWADDPSESLESEEIAFYAEGLLLEGFNLQWQILATPATPTMPDHIRLMIWQDGPQPPVHGWPILHQARWP